MAQSLDDERIHSPTLWTTADRHDRDRSRRLSRRVYDFQIRLARIDHRQSSNRNPMHAC